MAAEQQRHHLDQYRRGNEQHVDPAAGSGRQLRTGNGHYVDGLGNSENVTGPATPSLANVNDTGVVSINGIASQGQTFTASVSDVDGLPASVTYLWQSSNDGGDWPTLRLVKAWHWAAIWSASVCG